MYISGEATENVIKKKKTFSKYLLCIHHETLHKITATTYSYLFWCKYLFSVFWNSLTDTGFTGEPYAE